MSSAPAPIEPTTIPAEPVFAPGEDFAAMKAAVLGPTGLPAWCAGQWSDFNDHDPGIMLLEEILYGLTELPYRAGLPMPELLRDARGEIAWASNALYAPTQVLPMAPLTAADHEALLYDRVEGLLLAVVAPLGADAGLPAPELPGRLGALIGLDPDLPPDERARALTLARQVLDAQRALGERFERVEPLPPMRVTMEIDLVLPASADASALGAQLYAAIKQALAPGPRFCTLAEAAAEAPLDAVLTGPLLARGVLRPEDRPVLFTWPEARERASRAVLAAVPAGAAPSILFSQEKALAAAPAGTWFLPARVFAVRAGTVPVGARERRWRIQLGAPPLQPMIKLGRTWDAAGAESIEDLLTLANEGGPVSLGGLMPEAGWPMPMVAGAPATDVGEYVSIQRQFPACFALGPGALPTDASAERRAQVRQLRGYLVNFEQELANALSQLAHTADFFSVEPQTRTVFPQPLTDVPDLLALVDDEWADRVSLDPVVDPAAEAARAGAFWLEPSNPYRLGLQTNAESPEEFIARRHRVLDHLLARFGERFAPPTGATYETIRNKEDLLRDYPRLGEHRAAARLDAATATAGSDEPHGVHERRETPRSGLEARVECLLRGAGEPRAPFYFALETICFLPAAGDNPDGGEAAQAGGAAHADEAAAASVEVSVDDLRPAIFHVLLNPTLRPLTAEYVEHVRALVLASSPAHLWSRFVWLETRPESEAAVAEFRERLHVWQNAGAPALELATAAPTTSGAALASATLAVRAGTPAQALFAWLLAHVEGGGT